MILPSAMCVSSQTVALLLKVKAKVWNDFLDSCGEEQQEIYRAWNSLNHAIRSVQRQDGEVRKPVVVSRISLREAAESERRGPAKLRRQFLLRRNRA
jgi:hypothetical protein